MIVIGPVEPAHFKYITSQMLGRVYLFSVLVKLSERGERAYDMVRATLFPLRLVFAPASSGRMIKGICCG